mmetsp:Transcript_19713/g.47070  ORF Transcript_19713/g.47070 Transcript_19713/m.47070 type:complete len:203 (-) Transcript_19713:993-1601(-)
MAQQMVGLAEKGVTPRDISQCLHGIPFVPPSPPVPPQPPMRTNQAQPPEIPAATKRLKESGVDLRILSDSNTFFIDEILRFHGLASDFSLITTNHAHVDEQSILRVSHCHEHACPRCPPNLCKGYWVRSWLESCPGRVIYVGDGGGDFCGAIHLRAHDVVLPRKNWRLHKKLMTHRDLAPRMLPWQDYGELLRHIQELLQTS